MKNFFKGFDLIIFLCLILLSIFSLTIINSIALPLFYRQLIYILIGLVAFFIFSQIDFRIYRSFSWFIYFSGLFMLLITIIIGQVTRGSVRWLELGIFNFQPSEIFKPFIILFLASLLTEKRNKTINSFLLYSGLFFLPVFLVFKQPDLGNVIIYVAIFIGLIFFSGLNNRLIIPSILIVFLSSFLSWGFLKPYQKERLITFLDPETDKLGRSYNILQSIISVGSGGFFGRGFGRGTQSHLKFLPEYHTDFIFASLSEELGFFGSSLLLIIYLLLFLRILKIYKETDSQLAKLVIIGNFMMILAQMAINIGMSIGLLPITGITLPLISFGGSSILSIIIGLGIIENIAKNRPQKTALEIR